MRFSANEGHQLNSSALERTSMPIQDTGLQLTVNTITILEVGAYEEGSAFAVIGFGL